MPGPWMEPNRSSKIGQAGIGIGPVRGNLPGSKFESWSRSWSLREENNVEHLPVPLSRYLSNVQQVLVVFRSYRPERATHRRNIQRALAVHAIAGLLSCQLKFPLFRKTSNEVAAITVARWLGRDVDRSWDFSIGCPSPTKRWA